MLKTARPFIKVTRRKLLGLASTGAAGMLFGCGTARDDRGQSNLPEGGPIPRGDGCGGPSPAYDAAYGDAGSAVRFDDALAPTEGCVITDENILGPYYKADAPFRADIRDGQVGDALLLCGVVRAFDCRPLAGALVDVWQANAEGAYDNTGFALRGRVQTDEEGRYELVTIVPGRYLNGDTYRPAHVHYRVSHPEGLSLTTQLYFEGDPFNATDPFIAESLIMPLEPLRDAGVGVFRTLFDVTLASA